MRIARTLLVAGTTLGLAASGAAFAQEPIAEDQVRSFLQEASGQIEELLQARDFPRIVAWTQENIADGARFAVTSTLEAADERKMLTALRLDKQDMIALQRMALSAMYGDRAVEMTDATFEIEVVEVRAIGADTALARTRIVEAASLQRTGDAQVAQVPADVEVTGAIDGARIESVSSCEHVIQRAAPDDDRLQIGMSTCDARMEMMLGG